MLTVNYEVIIFVVVYSMCNTIIYQLASYTHNIIFCSKLNLYNCFRC